MSRQHRITLFSIALLATAAICVVPVRASTVSVNANDLVPRDDISVTPAGGTFEEGSTFQVPVFLNTEGNSINSIELHLQFSQNILSVVEPSGGKSIIGVWVEPPSYDNTNGTVTFIGTIPGGINTGAGLIANITFRAIAPGQAIVAVRKDSRTLIDDGVDSPTVLGRSTAEYTIVPKPPGSVNVYSTTHPLEDEWYNDDNPVLSWDKDAGVTGFSYLLDNAPNTVPEDTVITKTTNKAYQHTGDGVWYFHIKALKDGIWGSASNFALHIDTTPPAAFTPRVDYLTAAVIDRALVSFQTTDSLSGIDHYEIGIIDKTQPATKAPLFFQAESPYQLSFDSVPNAHVIIRAVDKAGNVRDESVDVSTPFLPLKFLNDNMTIILAVILAFITLAFLGHYFFGHHIIAHMKRVIEFIKKEEEEPSP